MRIGSVLNVEGKDSEVEKSKTISQIEEKEASHELKQIAYSDLASDSEKMKHELTALCYETDLIQETAENFRRNVISSEI